MTDQQGWTPRPDPTTLTTDALDAATDMFRRELSALRELVEARLSAMDKATELLARSVDRFPSDVDKAVGALRQIVDGEIRNVSDVTDQRFIAVRSQFESNALALTAALAAQKEAAAEQNKSNTLAIDKSETATKETVAANAAQAAAGRESLAREVADLKERLVRLESGGVATAVARSEQRLDAGSLFQLVGLLVAIGVALFAVIHG